MKKLSVLLLSLVVFVSGCKDKGPAPDPDFSADYVGEYWTETAFGNNSSTHNWVVTSDNKMLDIDYTINYVFRYQGKELKSTEKYKLNDIQVLNPTVFKIDQDAEFIEDGVKKIRHVEGEAVKSTNANGIEVIGITFKFKDPGSANPINMDFLEFKKK